MALRKKKCTKRFDSTKDIFINSLIKNGKKRTSEKIFANVFKMLQKLSPKSSRSVLLRTLTNNMSLIKLRNIANKKKRRNKQTRLLPHLLNKNSRIKFAIKLIIKNSNVRSHKKSSSIQLLSSYVLNSIKNLDETSTLRDDIHKISFNHKKYSHFRWF